MAVQGPVADDASYDLLGLYAPDEIPLAERLSFTLGGRFTWARGRRRARARPGHGQRHFLPRRLDRRGRQRTPAHGIPTEKERWSLYTGASQGFRSPNLSDLTRFDIARSGELETAAFDLKPEKFLTVEVGAKTVQKNWEAGAAYCHTFIDDSSCARPPAR